ncbi:MAG: peptidylprolyl isomerase [Planctomycetota bacterium]
MNTNLNFDLLAVASIVAMLFASVAMGQLAPDRLYYGIDRRIAMSASAPGQADGTPAEIRLYEPVSMEGVPAAEPVETAAIELGRVDLAGLFPRLWQAPASSVGVLYAQLAVAGEEVGPPVVLQPLVTPSRAVLKNRQTSEVGWPPVPKSYAGLRAYVDRHVVLETSAGEIEVRLRPDQAPNTSWNFRHLVEGGFYTDIVFHRIIEARPGREPFVIQVGDPTARGDGGPGYQFDLERTALPHDFGVLSMARSGDPDSNGSQVFLCLSRGGTSFLDGRYTSFGQSVRGADPIVDVSLTPVDERDRPTGDRPPKILSARLVDAPPYSRTPPPVTRPTAGADR